MKPSLGEFRIANLRKEHVRKALADWSRRAAYPGKKSKTPVQKISPRTVHHVFSTLRTAMHDALDDGAISVLPFAFTVRAAVEVKAYLSGPFGDERLVFPDPRTGEPWKPDTFSKVVSEMLGHTTTAITADLYTHILGDLKAQAADRLDTIFESAEKRRVVGAEEGA